MSKDSCLEKFPVESFLNFEKMLVVKKDFSLRFIVTMDNSSFNASALYSVATLRGESFTLQQGVPSVN